jgi:hypothetical protein
MPQSFQQKSDFALEKSKEEAPKTTRGGRSHSVSFRAPSWEGMRATYQTGGKILCVVTPLAVIEAG